MTAQAERAPTGEPKNPAVHPRDGPEQVVELPMAELHPFKGHPFHVIDDIHMQSTAQSIRDNGVLVPLIVRPRAEGGYEIISGHRRKRACEIIGHESVPAIVRELDDDAATLLMVDSNLQREQLLPSERAYAFKMKLDALKHQGRRASPTSAQVGQKLNTSIEKVAEKIGESKTQVQRYIRLTHLIPQLLQMVDDRQLAFSPAVELSFLTKQEQVELLDAMDSEQSHPSLSQAQRLRKLSESDSLSIIQMRNILSEEKANAEKVAMDYADFRDYFPPKTTDRQIHKVLIRLVRIWHRQQQLKKTQEAR